MIGTAAAAIAVAGSVLIAVLTSTGYVGAVVTLALLAALGGAVAVLAYERRAAGRLAERLARSDKRHAGELEQARSETRKHVTSTADRLAAAQRSAQRSTQQALTKELHVIGAATVDTARTLAQHSATEANTHDAAALTAMHQTQAIVNLFSLIPARGIVPPMGGWAASPDVVAVLVDELLTRRPRLVVECGSGVSTLWLALAIDTFGLDTRIVSLDHDPHYAAATRARLAQHRVDRHVEVRDASLVATGLEGHHTEWYDRGALTDLHDIGLLFVDGPPALTGPLVRWPAVPLLRERFAPAVTIVLDDVVRPAEQETTARWSVLLPDFTVERLPLQKQASVFRRG